MTLTLTSLFILFLVVISWNDSTKQKMIANQAAKQYCEEHQVDLLDDTVSYYKISFIRSPKTHFFYLQHQYKMRYFDPRTAENATIVLAVLHNEVSFIEHPRKNNVIYFNPPNQ